MISVAVCVPVSVSVPDVQPECVVAAALQGRAGFVIFVGVSFFDARIVSSA